MSFKPKEGDWFFIENEEQFKNTCQFGYPDPTPDTWLADVSKGHYYGPGLYMRAFHSQPCPRGCCKDSVCEVLPADKVADMVEKEITKLTEILNRARSGR